MKKIKYFFHLFLIFHFVVGNSHAMRQGIQNEDTVALEEFMRAAPDKKLRFQEGVVKRHPVHLRHSTGGRRFVSAEEDHLLINYQAALNLFLDDWQNVHYSSKTRAHAAFGRAKLMAQRGIYPAGVSIEAYRQEIIDNLETVQGFPDIAPKHHFHALLWKAVTLMGGYKHNIWNPGEQVPLEDAWDCLSAAEALKTKHNLSQTVYLWKALIVAEKGFRPLDDVLPPGVNSEEHHKAKALEWFELYKGITSRAPSSDSALFFPSHAAAAQDPRGIRHHTDYKSQEETQELVGRLETALSNWHTGDSEEEDAPESGEGGDDEGHDPDSGIGPQGTSHSQDPDSSSEDSDSESDDDGGQEEGNTAYSEGMGESLGFNLLSSEPMKGDMEEDSREPLEGAISSYDDRASGYAARKEIISMEAEPSALEKYRSEELPGNNSKRKNASLESDEERESEEEDQPASSQKAKKARSFENPLYERIITFLETHHSEDSTQLTIQEAYDLLRKQKIVTESQLQPQAVKTFIRKKLIKLNMLKIIHAANSKYEEIKTRLEAYSQSGQGTLTISDAMDLLVSEEIIKREQTKDKNYVNTVRRKLEKFKILKERDRALYSEEVEEFFASHKEAKRPNLTIEEALKTLRTNSIIPEKSESKESTRIKALVRLTLERLEIFAQMPPRQPSYDPLKKTLKDYAAKNMPPLSVAEAFTYLVEEGKLKESQRRDAGITALLKRELRALKIHKKTRENGPFYEVLESFFLGYKGKKLTVSEAWVLLIGERIVPQDAKDKGTLTNSSLRKALERHEFLKSSRKILDVG